MEKTVLDYFRELQELQSRFLNYQGDAWFELTISGKSGGADFAFRYEDIRISGLIYPSLLGCPYQKELDEAMIRLRRLIDKLIPGAPIKHEGFV